MPHVLVFNANHDEGFLGSVKINVYVIPDTVAKIQVWMRSG